MLQAENLQKVVAVPQGLYLVTYRGSLVDGEYVTIPRIHRRAGDLADNVLAYAIIQNCSGFSRDFSEIPGLHADSALDWFNYGRLRVHDGTNDFCNIIAWPNAWRMDTDQEIKISCSNIGAGRLTTYGLFTVAAYYKYPDE